MAAVATSSMGRVCGEDVLFTGKKEVILTATKGSAMVWLPL